MKKFKSLKERLFDFETRAVTYDGHNYIERVLRPIWRDVMIFNGFTPDRPLFIYTLKVSNRWSYLKDFTINTIDPVHRTYAYEYLKNFIQPYNRKNNPSCLPL